MKESTFEGPRTQIDSLIEQALGRLKTMIDVETVIGKAVLLDDGSKVFPIIKVSVGFVAGGGEYASQSSRFHHNKDYPFAGGTGAGFAAEPMGFLIAGNGGFQIVNMDNKNVFSTLLEKMGDFLSEFNTAKFKNEKKEAQQDDKE